MKKDKRTSATIAELAGRTLASPRASKTSKSLAASAFAQVSVRPKKKRADRA